MMGRKQIPKKKEKTWGVKSLEEDKTLESKYIQQHLANERTYLAWVRTSIAIIGIGFLASSLHFNNIRLVSEIADTIAVFVSVFSLIAGIIILIFATIHYFAVRKNINSQTFASANKLIKVSTTIIFLIFMLLGFYLISIMF
ncbi:DUF202 domain-containing protein [Bacillus sp. JJ1122]|uniref:YidH family protein n=1 Tax=Bacillus sp. JJ1122 TaxID=3122951 RepID=UPI002FFF7B23